MTEPLQIVYKRMDGTHTEILLRQVGFGEQWVLDLRERTETGERVVHQHAIEGEPEVRIG